MQTLINLNAGYGLIQVSGNQASSFLQGQFTCDIREITLENQGQLAAYCNTKGRVRVLVRIFADKTNINESLHYLLFLPKTLISNTITQLKKIALFSKVQVEEVSQQFNCMGLIERSSEDSSYTRNLVIDNKEKHPLNIRFTNEKIYDADIDNPNLWGLLDIRAGIPQIWPETVEQFLPHDLNLPQLGAVSFTKGCYCGQEIVARMEYRAKLKRHLSYRILPKSTPLPLPGTVLDAGIIVSACKNAKEEIEVLVITSIQDDNNY